MTMRSAATPALRLVPSSIHALAGGGAVVFLYVFRKAQP